MGKSGIAVGLNKGFIVTQVARRQKASHRKGKLGKRVDAIRHIIREVAGFAPYEKRCIELIKTNQTKDTKKCLKVIKRRLGTHSRAVKKREYLTEVVRQQRKKN